VSQEVTTANRPFVSLSFLRRLLLKAATAVVVSLLVMGTQQEAAWAQPADAPQVYCGPWGVEPWFSRSEGAYGWQFWTYRWCYSPEVSGGWYKDYAGYSRTAPETTLTNMASGDGSVVVGEPVTFHLTETNNSPYTLDSVQVVALPNRLFDFVSAASSQGQCKHESIGQPAIFCELGSLSPGATADIAFVIIPQSPGILESLALDTLKSDESGESARLTEGFVSASVSVYVAE
jgi:hypothetical protein